MQAHRAAGEPPLHETCLTGHQQHAQEPQISDVHPRGCGPRRQRCGGHSAHGGVYGRQQLWGMETVCSSLEYYYHCCYCAITIGPKIPKNRDLKIFFKNGGGGSVKKRISALILLLLFQKFALLYICT